MQQDDPKLYTIECPFCGVHYDVETGDCICLTEDDDLLDDEWDE